MLVFCVNDGAVMDAWGRDQGIEKSKGFVKFMADPSGAATRALDIALTHPGPASKGLLHRCKRTATYFEDGVVKFHSVAEGPDDPAGDARPEATCAEALLEAVASVNPLKKVEL